MKILTTDIQKLRQETGAGIMAAKKALEEAGGKYETAKDALRKKGQAMAAKKVNRETGEGVIGYYIHSNGKVAALVALACESDFVANTEDFKDLAHNLAMHVAATDSEYISPDEVPEEQISKEKEVFQEMLKKEKKPEKVRNKIIEGKIEKYYSEICLLKQPFIKEDKITIEQLIQEKVLKLGENIQIKEFKKISL